MASRGMPLNLVLVRHGESEGNLAKKMYRDHGDRSGYEALVSAHRYDPDLRLTRNGESQARKAGDWIRTNLSFDFYRYYSSPYIRARETSANLNLSYSTGSREVEWFLEPDLREREWGLIGHLMPHETEALYPGLMDHKKRNPLLWAPPGGESMLRMVARLRPFFDTLHRECSEQNVICVCHGELMWGFRTRLERMSPERYRKLDRSRKDKDRIHNCQILQYSRVNPHTGSVEAYLNWMRSICPWDTSKSSNDWEEVKRPRFTNAALRRVVKTRQRILGNQ